MLKRVDRIQVVVRDPIRAAEAWEAILGTRVVREGAVESLRAHRTVLRAGRSEIDLLQPTGPGPAADRLGAWGEGLFAAGFAVENLDDRLRLELDGESLRKLQNKQQEQA